MKFVLSVPPGPDGMIRLHGKDYHYLARVRRLKPGSFFDAILPGGAETQVRVVSTVDSILLGECLGISGQVTLEQAPTKQVPPIALFQGLPKGAKMDLIVRQAAEAGVFVVAPFEADYSTARINNDKEKITRWERIVREGRQQSGSAMETTLRPPSDFGALLDYWESIRKEYRRPLGLLLHQDPLEEGTFHGYLYNKPDFVALAVGPEGGFSPKEISLFLEAGFKPLVLGNTILRTETAALYGIAAIRIILLEYESWAPKE